MGLMVQMHSVLVVHVFIVSMNISLYHDFNDLSNRFDHDFTDLSNRFDHCPDAGEEWQEDRAGV